MSPFILYTDIREKEKISKVKIWTLNAEHTSLK